MVFGPQAPTGAVAALRFGHRKESGRLGPAAYWIGPEKEVI